MAKRAYFSYALILLGFLLIGVVVAIFHASKNRVSQAVAGPLLASDLLGQLDGVGSPLYTKSGQNDGPNTRGFNSPSGIAIDATNHRLFVSDTGNSRVLVFNLAADNTFTGVDRIADYVLGQANFFANTTATTQNGMSGPRNLLYAAASNRLFVSDNSNNRVLVFDVATITNGENAVNVLGQSDFQSSTVATTPAALWFPLGLTLDASGNRLFIVDANNNRVLVFDIAVITNGENAVNVLGQTSFTASGAATSQSGMNWPQGAAYDASGQRLFVSEAVNNRVLTFDVSTITNGESAVNVLGQLDFVSSTVGLSQNKLASPQGVTYNSSNSYLFVGDSGYVRVMIFDVASITNGENAVNVLGQSDFTSGAATTLQNSTNGPVDLVVDAAGNRLFVAEDSNHRVTVFDIGTIGNGENAVDAVGQLDGLGNPLYTQQGPNGGPNPQGFDNPSRVAIDTVGHRLFVTDTSNRRVLVFNLDTNNSFGAADRIADNVLGQNNFYSKSVTLSQSGMSSPQGLAYDGVNSRLFVSDFNYNRILVFDVANITDGENAAYVLGQSDFISNEGEVSQNRLNNPRGIAYNTATRHLYVADSAGNRVLIFDVASITNGENAVNVLGQGDFISGTAATAQNRMNNPSGVAVDQNTNRLFVADRDNNRVLVFDITTISNGEGAVNVLGQLDFVSSGGAVTQSGITGPKGLAFDGGNNLLFMSESGEASRVLIFDVASITNGENAIAVLGQTSFTASSSATSQAGMDGTSGLAFDPANNRIFVVDNGNRRVMVFDVVRITTTSLGGILTNFVPREALSSSGGGGTRSYSISSGALPAGVTLNSNGTFSGGAASPGTYTFTVRATDTFDSTGSFFDNQILSLNVTLPGSPPNTPSPSPTSTTSQTAGAEPTFSPTPTPLLPITTPSLFLPVGGTLLNLGYSHGLLVRGPDDPTIYLLEEDQRIPVPDDLLALRGYGDKRIITTPTSAILTEIPLHDRSLGLPDGSLVSSLDDRAIYVISQGRRYPLSEASLATLGYSRDTIVSVSPSELDRYPLQSSLPPSHPEGALIKAPDSPNVYRIMQGRRRFIPSLELLFAFHFQTTPVATTNIDLYPEGAPLSQFPSGTLMKTPYDPAIYLIDGDYTRPFLSQEAFLNLGYRFTDVISVSQIGGEYQMGRTIF
ncbi:MAG: beta-propeller fold lactonase family protein [Parcubacteria group bacterium]|nr:beta-propeller fold lactonase family protein [Parcubacteria group bacterium]